MHWRRYCLRCTSLRRRVEHTSEAIGFKLLATKPILTKTLIILPPNHLGKHINFQLKNCGVDLEFIVCGKCGLTAKVNAFGDNQELDRKNKPNSRAQ